MKTKRIVPYVFGLFLLLLGNGCVTQKLWENDNLESWNEPAPNPRVGLFVDNQKGDMLVVYDELSERHSVTHTRAYWLNENEKLLEQRHAPHFVSTNLASALVPIPVLLVTTNQIAFPPPPYALVETNGRSFTLHLDRDQNTYDLPNYNDGKGKVEKFALTPLANVADISIVGGVLGYYILQGMAASGANYSWKP
jgi:hypothetical protein